ncbi:MAG: tRNA pseudouridine(55) synthase TruB [Deltaproteobacteria bacterium]|nr:tRNA pseudouridine(55) synthase TruB [Deltaproteobacteria bacterium]
MAIHGVLVLDKPTGLSSASAVEHVKRTLGADRAGHGGTLDPIATGVLTVCLGAGTKIAQYLLADDKAYEADGVLGIETDTLDRSGQVVAERPVRVTEEALRAAIAARLGEQDQIPPIYSAIKQGGVRNYHRARQGETVEPVARRIRIDRLELLAFTPPRFRIAIACSKGTYIRSIVADLGTDVGCGAYLSELRRTRSGLFSIEQAVRMDQVAGLDLATGLVRLPDATALPRAVVAPELMKPVLSGVQLAIECWDPALHALPPGWSVTPPLSAGTEGPRFQLVDDQDRLIAIVHAEGGKTIYDRVFPELVRA